MDKNSGPSTCWELRFEEPEQRTIVLSPHTRSATVGRDDSCDVLLDPRDVEASLEHARLDLLEDCVRVVDLESTNGTFINGARVESAFAHVGAELRFGRAIAVLALVDVGERVGDPEDADAGRPGSGRRRMLSVALVVLAALILWMCSGLGPHPNRTKKVRLQQGIDAYERLDWDASVEALAPLVAASTADEASTDPEVALARRYLDAARQEKNNEYTLSGIRQVLGDRHQKKKQRCEKANAELETISEGSVYRADSVRWVEGMCSP